MSVEVRPIVESQSVVRRAASAWLGGNASTVFRALAASSWLGVGAALATASVGLACCVVKSGARHMLALRGESLSLPASTTMDCVFITSLRSLCRSLGVGGRGLRPATQHNHARHNHSRVRAIVQGRPLPGPRRVLEERAACFAPSSRLDSPAQRPAETLAKARSTGARPPTRACRQRSWSLSPYSRAASSRRGSPTTP